MDALCKSAPVSSGRPGSLRRWLVFNAVGGLGFVVQLGVLAFLMGWCGWGYVPATALAVETAVVHNFVWHEMYTWADRRQPGRFAVLCRLLRFNLTNGLVSVAGNLFFMRVFLHTLPVHYLTANTLSIAMCAIINFIASDRLVFRGPGVVPSFGLNPRPLAARSWRALPFERAVVEKQSGSASVSKSGSQS